MITILQYRWNNIIITSRNYNWLDNKVWSVNLNYLDWWNRYRQANKSTVYYYYIQWQVVNNVLRQMSAITIIKSSSTCSHYFCKILLAFDFPVVKFAVKKWLVNLQYQCVISTRNTNVSVITAITVIVRLRCVLIDLIPRKPINEPFNSAQQETVGCA